jgi:hypothetical protein
LYNQNMRHEADTEPGTLPYVIGLGLGLAALNGDRRAAAFIDEAVEIGARFSRKPKASELVPTTVRRRRAIIIAWMAVVREAKGPHRAEALTWLKSWSNSDDPSVLLWLWPFIKGAAGWNQGDSRAMLNSMVVSVAQRPGRAGLELTRRLIGGTRQDARRLAEVPLDPAARNPVHYLRRAAARLRNDDEYADEDPDAPKKKKRTREKETILGEPINKRRRRRWAAAQRAGELARDLGDAMIIEVMAMRRRHRSVGTYSKPQAAENLGMSLGGVQYLCAKAGIIGKITEADLAKLAEMQDKRRAVRRAAEADKLAEEQADKQVSAMLEPPERRQQ